MAVITRKLVLLSILLLVLGPGVNDANAQDRNAYSINPGDSLLISVWREEGLSIEVLVTPDGNCTFPLIGQVKAAGRTSEAVADEVVERLKQFMPDPVVVVSVVSILGNKVYIIGQVNDPGEYVMSSDLDVMQALSVAGGATPFAELNDIRILRRTADGLTAIGFRYNEVVRGRNLEQNIVLQSGDLIVVP
jgi:polysaccharide export outer membrane protein